ncbi:hypothetical protein [Nannocystis sp.]|uniref:hypothetical protein n=1 Tax=Nannocystis sp. TaxID=1962667 RepID=UPI0025FB3366|nr:hypothetical protein [Nannocystis sp.]MBK7826763.1 hypothetical protein [Nannocystis sp.]
MKPQRVASWLIFAIGLGLGLAGLVATAPARVVDIGRRGQLESGCRFEASEGGWRVAGLYWAESEADAPTGCGRFVGATLRAIDGVAVADVDTLLRLAYAPRDRPHAERQRWTVEGRVSPRLAAEPDAAIVTLRPHPVVASLARRGVEHGAVLVAALEAFGALLLTLNVLLASALLLLPPARVTAAPALAGALLAATLGCAFDVGFTPAWYQPVAAAALILGVLGLATAALSLPEGKIRGALAIAYIVGWAAFVAVGNLPWLPLHEHIPAGAATIGHLLFAGAGLVAMRVRERRSASRRRASAIRWVALALVLPALALLPAVIPWVSPFTAEFSASVVFPIATMVLPLCILYGLSPRSRFDLVAWVRTAMLVNLLAASWALLLAAAHLLASLLLPPSLRPSFTPAVLLGVAAALAITTYSRRRALWGLVDILVLPTHVRARRAVPEAASNLVDCWDRSEIDWCVQRAFKGGFNAASARVALRSGEGWRDLVSHEPLELALSDAERGELAAGRGVSWSPDEHADCTTEVLPLHSRGVFLGVIIAGPADVARSIEWDQALMLQIASSVAEAVWRCTRVADRDAGEPSRL